MDKIENILEQALQEIRQGKTLREILDARKDSSLELEALLTTVSPLFNLPGKQIPEPARQRKYVLAPRPTVWLAWLHLTRFAGVSVGVILLISAVTTTAFATFSSLPGSALFSLKKGTEQLQLTLAQSQEAKADLQIKITQKRLNEAREVFSQQNGAEKEKAAISELLAQTKNAIEVTNELAIKNPEPEKNQTAVNILENITQQQQTLLKQIKPENGILEETKLALAQTQQNLDKVNIIKRYIATASKEESLTDLNGLVKISGAAGQVSENKLVVDKYEIYFNDKTIIKNDSGALKQEDIKNMSLVEIKARPNAANQLVAQEIFVRQKDASGIVKGISTTASSTEHTVSTPKESASGTSTPPAPAADPNIASGNVIFEDPTPTIGPN